MFVLETCDEKSRPPNRGGLEASTNVHSIRMRNEGFWTYQVSVSTDSDSDIRCFIVLSGAVFDHENPSHVFAHFRGAINQSVNTHSFAVDLSFGWQSLRLPGIKVSHRKHDCLVAFALRWFFLATSVGA